jgi:benzylsuccinate CoA-transferase BbsF subunit
MRSVFTGIRIADFTWYVAGPVVTKYFAQYGAQVIHVETSIKIDGHRSSPPFRSESPAVNTSALFATSNDNKYGITLNLKHPKGLDIAKRLVAWADVIAENFTPGTMERLGLGYDELKKINPRIIMFSTSNQGQTGPRRSQPGFGSHLTALSGFTNITGWPDRSPSVPWGPYTDFASIHFATFALTAALEYRHRTGKGQHLDLSQYESSLHLLTPLLLDYQVNGREFTRMGNRSQCAAPHGVYPCKGEERWCAIAIFTDDEWRRFCQVSGKPSWLSDPRFSTLTKRKENEDELDRLIGEWSKDFSAEDVMVMLQSAGVSAGIVENAKDLSEDPQLKYRHYFKELEHPEIGKYLCEGNAFCLSKIRPDFRMPAPCLGEHNEYVYTKVLGMSDKEFIELLSEGVFE